MALGARRALVEGKSDKVALETPADLTRPGMEALGFFVCVQDLEDELIRCLV